MSTQTVYRQDIEVKMKRLFATVSEKDRRRYVAIEAAKLGSGGISVVSGLFELDAKTVRRGLTSAWPTTAWRPTCSRPFRNWSPRCSSCN